MTLTHNFAGTHARILHPSESVAETLQRRLSILGVSAVSRWPALTPEDAIAGLVLIDLDRAHDEQLPWPRGEAPMPVIGLIGSESPGRLAWGIEHRVDAFLPLAASANLYSALVIASAAKARRSDATAREAEIARRGALRLEVISAVLDIMAREDVDEALALKRLRAFAMVERLPLEDAATRYLAEHNGADRSRA